MPFIEIVHTFQTPFEQTEWSYVILLLLLYNADGNALSLKL